MNLIYTEPTKCQDCYKCLRICPVKSIKFEDARAQILPSECIFCGNCVNTCPSKAKKVRSDLARVNYLLKEKKEVYVSLAPSFLTEFKNITPARLIRGLLELGFKGVSETALGAQEVSANIIALYKERDPAVYISNTCPATTLLIEKYYPHLYNLLTPLLSPALAHAKLLRSIYGQQIGIVFINPCIAKKGEIERVPGLIDVSITFTELRQLFKMEGIDLDSLSEGAAQFVPHAANLGVLYPIEGGIIYPMQKSRSLRNLNFMNFSGVSSVMKALDGMEIHLLNQENIFIEMLACDGGCVNGPCTKHLGKTIKKRLDIFNYLGSEKFSFRKTTGLNILTELSSLSTQEKLGQVDSEEIEKLLHRLKASTENEGYLDCGGCGYSTCYEFALAVLNARAEITMCVSHMRELALKKANALMETMPSGVIIVDKELLVIECNKKFVEIMGSDLSSIYEIKPGLTGAHLDRLVSFAQEFKHVLMSDEPLKDKLIRHHGKIIHLSIFTIEKHEVVGGIVQDVTIPSIQRHHIIDQAKSVMEKQIQTVQQIAYLLGENAAESEVIIKSIIDSFGMPND